MFGYSKDSASVIRKGRQRLLTAVSGLVVAAAVSMTGAQEAKAICDNSFSEGLNCLANANGPGGGIGNDISELNFAAGFLNGSGNGNSLGTGEGFNGQFFNAWFGIANDSGNANVASGDGDAANFTALNFYSGIGNGSGNAFVLDTDDELDDLAALHVAVGNTYFGLGNGALNGVNLARGRSLVIQTQNHADGIFNLSGNAGANDLANCEFGGGESTLR